MTMQDKRALTPRLRLFLRAAHLAGGNDSEGDSAAGLCIVTPAHAKLFALKRPFTQNMRIIIADLLLPARGDIVSFVKTFHIWLDVNERGGIQDVHILDIQDIVLDLEEFYHAETQGIGTAGCPGCKNALHLVLEKGFE